MQKDDNEAAPIPPKISGPWDRARIDDFLRVETKPIRLAVNGGRGYPILTPFWYLWAEGAFWLAARPETAICRSLALDPRCAFEVSVETPPYMGVRGRGRAEILPDGQAVLQKLLERYLGGRAPEFQKRLLSESADERAIAVRPERMASWDFSKRMRR